MATNLVLTSSQRKQRLYNSSGESVTDRSDFVASVQTTSPKTSGNWVDIKGGVKFRKATTLSKFTSTVQVGAPQIYEGIRTDALRKGQAGYTRESPGGCYGDNLLRQSTCARMVSGNSVTSAIAYPSNPTMMQNEAVTKALLNLADQKAGTGEDLATYAQTIRMLHKPLTAIISLIAHARADYKLWKFYWRQNARALGRANIVDAAAKRYLEYVYGVRPLMQDIYGLIELSKHLGEKPLLLHGWGTSKQQSSLSDFTYSDISFKSKTAFSGGTEELRSSCSLWAQLDPEWDGARTLNQCGLLNPASLAWELVSMSFVVDWLCPIGPVLSALTAPAGLKFVDGTTSIRAKCRAQLENWGYGLEGQPYSWTTTSKATAIWTYEGYVRKTLDGFPLPGFWFNSDPLGLNRDSDRPFKALALLITNLKAFR